MNKRKQKIGLLTVSIFFILALAMTSLPLVEESQAQVVVTDISPVRDYSLSADPIISTGPVLHNADYPGPSHMYARARNYAITVNVSDADTFNNFDYVSISLFHDLIHTSALWTLRFD